MKPRTLINSALVLTLPVIAAIPAAAQVEVKPTSTVRVTTPTDRATGHLVLADSGRVRLETARGGHFEVPAANVTRLELRGHHAKEGAITLGVLGFITGAALGAALVEGLCETSNCNDDLPAAMGVVGLTFGATGALGGAIIGALIPKWTRIDPTQVRVGLAFRP